MESASDCVCKVFSVSLCVASPSPDGGWAPWWGEGAAVSGELFEELVKPAMSFDDALGVVGEGLTVVVDEPPALALAVCEMLVGEADHAEHIGAALDDLSHELSVALSAFGLGAESGSG